MSRLRTSWVMHAFMALVWCSFVAARPAVLACPTGGHGAAHGVNQHAAMSGGEAVVGDVHTAHSAQSAHSEHAAHGAPMDEPTEQTPAPHPCDCLGHCCAIAAIAQQPSAEVLRIVERVGQAPLPQEHPTLASRWVDFVLPFAIAPPVSVRS